MPDMSWHGMPLQIPWPRGPLRHRLLPQPALTAAAAGVSRILIQPVQLAGDNSEGCDGQDACTAGL